VRVVEPGVGRLAGGDEGAGRLADPDVIVAAVEALLGPRDLDGVSVLVTAGGTREPIDAVRVITNRSSGKQGYALAAEAAQRGAVVTLVTTVDRPAPAGVHVVPVATAAQMEEAVMQAAIDIDVVIMAAAVADFRPKAPADRKLKKDEGVPEIILEPTHDFLVDLGRAKGPGQIVVGFAAETDDVLAGARRKLDAKHLDLIVANDVGAPGAGFEHDTNAVTLIGADGEVQDVPLIDKREVARVILDAVVARRNRSTS
jgi:phosphopantothenoylcysteine decarboxylase/phosphopantothenate--cysteine ligase